MEFIDSGPAPTPPPQPPNPPSDPPKNNEPDMPLEDNDSDETGNDTEETSNSLGENGRSFGEWCLRIFLLVEGGVEVTAAAAISAVCFASPAVTGGIGFLLYPAGITTSWCTYILGEHWWNYFKETFYIGD